MSIEEVNKLAKGQVWTERSSQNKFNHTWFFENAIKKAASLANIERYNVKESIKEKVVFLISCPL